MVDIWKMVSRLGWYTIQKNLRRRELMVSEKEEHSYRGDYWIIPETGLPDLQGPFQPQEDSRR